MALQVSAIMLGVQDVDRAKRFYAEGLGCTVDHDFPSFARCDLGKGSSKLALYEWDAAGGTVVEPAAVPDWGGYFGYFSDPAACGR